MTSMAAPSTRTSISAEMQAHLAGRRDKLIADVNRLTMSEGSVDGLYTLKDAQAEIAELNEIDLGDEGAKEALDEIANLIGLKEMCLNASGGNWVGEEDGEFVATAGPQNKYELWQLFHKYSRDESAVPDQSETERDDIEDKEPQEPEPEQADLKSFRNGIVAKIEPGADHVTLTWDFDSPGASAAGKIEIQMRPRQGEDLQDLFKYICAGAQAQAQYSPQDTGAERLNGNFMRDLFKQGATLTRLQNVTAERVVIPANAVSSKLHIENVKLTNSVAAFLSESVVIKGLTLVGCTVEASFTEGQITGSNFDKNTSLRGSFGGVTLDETCELHSCALDLDLMAAVFEGANLSTRLAGLVYSSNFVGESIKNIGKPITQKELSKICHQRDAELPQGNKFLGLLSGFGIDGDLLKHTATHPAFPGVVGGFTEIPLPLVTDKGPVKVVVAKEQGHEPMLVLENPNGEDTYVKLGDRRLWHAKVAFLVLDAIRGKKKIDFDPTREDEEIFAV